MAVAGVFAIDENKGDARGWSSRSNVCFTTTPRKSLALHAQLSPFCPFARAWQV